MLSVFCTEARAQIDSLQLDSTVLSAQKKRLLDLSRTGAVTMDMQELALMPSVLGNADPLHFLQMLPSMQTSSEFDAGIHIQGCDHQHNLVALDGVPIYGATHLMGIFSVFNPTHYSSMSYSTVAAGANRLGGIIDMHTRRSIPERVGLDASVGLVSAQGTLEAPISGKSALVLSGRGSLVDLLYGRYLHMDDMWLSYGFSDVNASWIWTPTREDRIAVDMYYGRDKVVSEKSGTEMGIDMFWANAMAAIHWDHGALEQTLYYTANRLSTDIIEEGRQGHLPASIATVGYKGGWSRGQLSLMADLAAHEVQPQSPTVVGTGVEYEQPEIQRAFETTLSGGWSGTIGFDFDYSATLAGTWFLSAERQSYFGLSPQLSGTWHLPGGDQLRASAGVHRQYLFQTGFSNLGLPLEFWLPAGKYSDPQWSVGTSLAWDKPLPGGIELNSELYYRYLGNQIEFVSGFQDLLAGTYSLERSLQKGQGYAYGLNLLARKTQGRLTGWAGLSAGRSMRMFDGGTWPSSHERLVEFDLVAAYSVGRWDLGGTVVAAGGTPFTEVKEYYMLQHQVVSVMGPYNGGRLSPYFRLDLNARLRLRDHGRMQHGLNFSVYNATAHNQEIFRKVHSMRDELKIKFERMYLGITVLPSVGYYLKF